VLGALAAAFALAGLWLGFAAPEDYQQGDTVRIMFIHVPAAWLSLFAYACLGGRASPGWSGATRWRTPPRGPRRRWARRSPCWRW
jgi:hypothetical protein